MNREERIAQAEERQEREADEVMRDFRKGRISARMRDSLLVELGFEPINKTGRYTNNGGGSRHQIGARG